MPFLQWLWHKTAVRVFLERFVLTVLAAITVLAINNSMKLDWTERISLAVAAIAIAVFVGRRVEKDRRPVPVPSADFATAEWIGSIERIAGFEPLGLYKVGYDTYATRIDCVIILQITIKDKPTTLNFISIEEKTSDGWMLLKRLPASAVTLYYRLPENKAKQISIVGTDLSENLLRNFEPGKSFVCFGYFEYTASWKTAEDKFVYRLTMKNSLGETVSVELRSANNPDVWSGPSWSLTAGKKNVDLSKIPMRDFFSQEATRSDKSN